MSSPPAPALLHVVVNDERFIAESHLVNCLAQVYRNDTRSGVYKLAVAVLCDDWLDPSGRLLGKVRDKVVQR